MKVNVIFFLLLEVQPYLGIKQKCSMCQILTGHTYMVGMPVQSNCSQKTEKVLEIRSRNRNESKSLTNLS
jgi:hypothetical protein